VGEALAAADTRFHEAMNDDFNSAKAIGHLFDLSREINRALDEGLAQDARGAAAGMLRLGGVLGLFWNKPGVEEWPEEVHALVGEREAARKSRDWSRADAIRGRLAELGVTVEDSPQGPKIKKA